jgi:acyl-CoA thioester hydrolase
MADLFLTYRGTVYPWQCDHMGHMNVMYYTGKFDEATWQMFATIGVTPTFLRSQKRGVAAIRQNTTYRKELLPGDVISIYSGILEMRDKFIRYYHEMKNDDSGEIAATTMISGVFLNVETRKSCLFPEEIVQRGLERIVDIQPLI